MKKLNFCRGGTPCPPRTLQLPWEATECRPYKLAIRNFFTASQGEGMVSHCEFMEVSQMDRRCFLKSLLGLASLPFFLSYPQTKPKAISTPKEVLLLETVVAGFFYYQGEIWEKLAPDQPLRLVREPENPYDERAAAL